MGFQDCDRHAAMFAYFKVENDGDTVVVFFPGEPVPRESSMKGVKRMQFAFPVVDEEGLKVWTVGKRLYHQLKKQWPELHGKPVKITRNGAKGSTETTYDFAADKATKKLEEARGNVSDEDVRNVLHTVRQVPAENNDDIPF